jgi:rod shape-determining protein MreD
VRRVVFAVVSILAAVLLQTVVLDRLPFPGGTAPDLVLVLVVTLGLASGPLAGGLIGFGAGLALDVAPPASGLLGLSALVFCLVGYGSGRLRGPLERSSWLPLAVVMLAAAAGEVLYALVGLTFGDPDITPQSIRLVLPVAVVYDILLCPFVLYLVVRFSGYGAWAPAGTRGRELGGRELAGAGLLGGAAAASAAAAGTAVRDTRGGREPRLRPAAARQADGWIGGHQRGPGKAAGSGGRRRPLQLRARDGVAGSAAASQMARARPAGPAARPVQLRLAGQRRGDGVLGGSLRNLVSGSLGYPGGLPGATGLPRASSRLSARAFRDGGPAGKLGDGSSRGPLRPVPSRLRARALRGSSALAGAGRGKAGRPTRLRLRARRGDGVLGGGVLGNGTSRIRMPGRGLPGSAFTPGRAPAAPSLRTGHGAAPRFRGTGRSTWRDRILPGRRRSRPGGRGGLLVGRSGFGVSHRRRLAVWGRGSNRTGGAP